MNDTDQIEAWAKFVATLRPLEQLALIGLADKYPTLTPSKIEVSRIVGEEKCFRASRWLNDRFRKLLYCYCEVCSTVARPVEGKSSDATSLIVAVATLLMAATHITMAPAVAFAAWALQSGVKLWCEQYGKVRLDGRGSYDISPYANYFGDFPVSDTPQTLNGTFVAIYFPAITAVVRDPKYKQPVHKVDIKQPARAEGHFYPESMSSMATISEYCDPKHEHRFAFSDTVSGRKMSGTIQTEQLNPVGSDFPFVSEDVTLTHERA